MKTRERMSENPANRLHNDPLRETSGKLHSARRRDPRFFVQFEKSRGEQRTWHSGRERERHPSLSRRIVPRAKLQNFSDVADTRYTPCSTNVYIRTAFIFSGWKADTIFLVGVLSSARESCASNSALLAKQVDNVSREIVISHRITRGKIYPVRACISAHRESFP